MANQRKLDPVTIEDARIVFRNFAGNAGKFNREGDRNFAVLLPPDIAEAMAADGWNVKTLAAREEGDDEQPYVQVTVSYKGRPPHIVLITSQNRTALDEGTVELLDVVDIEKVDLIVNPYEWELASGANGVKAYLKTMFITIREDELQLKYSNLDELPTRSGRTNEG